MGWAEAVAVNGSGEGARRAGQGWEGAGRAEGWVEVVVVATMEGRAAEGWVVGAGVAAMEGRVAVGWAAVAEAVAEAQVAGGGAVTVVGVAWAGAATSEGSAKVRMEEAAGGGSETGETSVTEVLGWKRGAAEKAASGRRQAKAARARAAAARARAAAARARAWGSAGWRQQVKAARAMEVLLLVPGGWALGGARAAQCRQRAAGSRTAAEERVAAVTGELWMGGGWVDRDLVAVARGGAGGRAAVGGAQLQQRRQGGVVWVVDLMSHSALKDVQTHTAAQYRSGLLPGLLTRPRLCPARAHGARQHRVGCKARHQFKQASETEASVVKSEE